MAAVAGDECVPMQGNHMEIIYDANVYLVAVLTSLGVVGLPECATRKHFALMG